MSRPLSDVVDAKLTPEERKAFVGLLKEAMDDALPGWIADDLMDGLEVSFTRHPETGVPIRASVPACQRGIG